MRITFIRAEIEVQQSEKKQHRIQAIHVHQIFYYWRRHTSPHLTNIIIFFETETEFHSIMKREYNKEIKEKYSGREA